MITKADGKQARATQLLEEMRASVDGLLADGASVGDLKVASAALREMRAAFALFAPYRGTRKVACFGSARTEIGDPTFRLAEAFARRVADEGFLVITGAGPGIMEACQRGAGRERSFGMNILLPFEQAANVVIRGDAKLLNFKYFFTRKLFFVKEAHAAALFPGGFGTHDEGFELLTLLQTGKSQPMPLVMLDKPRGTYWRVWDRYVRDHLLKRRLISAEDLSLYRVTDSVETAAKEVAQFFRVYHSSRYVRDLLVLRLRYPLPKSRLAELAREFGDIITDGALVQRHAFSLERDEPELAHLPRLAFRFDRLHFGRLRQMIDRINDVPVEVASRPPAP